MEGLVLDLKKKLNTLDKRMDDVVSRRDRMGDRIATIAGHAARNRVEIRNLEKLENHIKQAVSESMTAWMLQLDERHEKWSKKAENWLDALEADSRT